MSAASTSAILRRIPSELLEEILLKLPVKSLVRFSTVSKSWLSMISESGFVQEHKRRAAVNDVERMVTVSLHDHLNSATSVRRIPHTSSMGIDDDDDDDSTHLICPIEGTLRRLRAFCDGLWLVEAETIVVSEKSRIDEAEIFEFIEAGNFERLEIWKYLSGKTEKSLYLWNHSMRRHRKLPDSLLPTTTDLVYGLGYDSAGNDYKVLKIAREESSFIPTELYSLKSDSWKTISPPPGINWQRGQHVQERCEFVNGSFHWIRTFSNTIVSFDLSTEKCGEIMFPATALESKYKEHGDYDRKYVEVMVMGGKLCVSVNNAKLSPDGFCFALWVMEEYGVETSWTKMLNIEYGDSVVSRPLYEYFFYPIGSLSPLYLYDNGDVLFNTSNEGLCMYRKAGTLFRRIVARNKTTLGRGFIYVESLVSPRVTP